MGLYVSHDCWRASYGKFHHFRTAVGLVVGVPLDLMEGHYDKDEWMLCAGETALHKNLLQHRLKSLPIPWTAWEDDPISLLLHHSDCDGEIRWENCVGIAERLEEIAPQIVHPEGQRDDWNFKESALEFAAGLRRAAELQENVEFA